MSTGLFTYTVSFKPEYTLLALSPFSGSSLAMSSDIEEAEPKSHQQQQPPELQLSRSKSSVHSAVNTFSPFREAIFILVVCMSQFMTQAGLGVCLSPLDIIGDSFQITNPGVLSWLIASYSLTSGTFILFFGRCGDLFGYRVVYVAGWIWFSLWSMVAGVSVYSNYVLFIFARTFQGIGPAMLLPNGLALFGATYKPGLKKYMAFSLFGAMAPSGSILAAVFSAIFAQLAWWPWAYWAMAIYTLILAVISHLVIPPTPSSAGNLGFLDLMLELDIIGAFFGITGLVLVNTAWNQAPVVGWEKAYVYVILIIGAVFLAAFFVYEIYFASRPLIPFDALSVDVSFSLGCVACGWSCFGIWIYYLWRFFETIRGHTPLLSSAEFVPPCVVGFMASFTTGFLLSKVNPGYIMLVSMMSFTLGSIFTSIAPVHQTYWALTFVTLIVMPWGMDMSFPAATAIMSDAVSRGHQGIAASLVTTVVNYAISIGLGFAGTVETHVNNGGHTLHDTLKGYRGALYLAIGLGGLGIATSLGYLFKTVRRSRRDADSESQGQNEAEEKGSS